MLENLDKIGWRNLQHAYGEASDVPGLIRALAASDEEVRRGTIYELYGNIWHQGTVYEATSYAVPFLIELLGDDEVQGKDEILKLLYYLANGHSYKAVHQALVARWQGEEAVNSPQYQAEMQVELYWVKQAHDAVAEGVKVYLGLLEHADAKVRMCVPFTLVCLPECATEIMPIVSSHLEAESDPQVRASLLLCLAVFAADRSQNYSQLFRDMVKMENEDALVKLAAAMGLVKLMGDNIPEEAVQRLIEAVTNPEEVEEAYEALPWNDAGVVADASMVLCNLAPAVSSIALSPCLEALKKASPYSALSLTTALLYLTFSGPLQEGRTVQDLSEDQKTVLVTLLECEEAWKINVNMAGILESFGLPRWREQMRAFLMKFKGQN